MRVPGTIERFHLGHVEKNSTVRSCLNKKGLKRLGTFYNNQVNGSWQMQLRLYWDQFRKLKQTIRKYLFFFLIILIFCFYFDSWAPSFQSLWFEALEDNRSKKFVPVSFLHIGYVSKCLWRLFYWGVIKHRKCHKKLLILH